MIFPPPPAQQQINNIFYLKIFSLCSLDNRAVASLLTSCPSQLPSYSGKWEKMQFQCIQKKGDYEVVVQTNSEN